MVTRRADGGLAFGVAARASRWRIKRRARACPRPCCSRAAPTPCGRRATETFARSTDRSSFCEQIEDFRQIGHEGRAVVAVERGDADATESGDYFQVCFDTDTDDGHYLLVQRQFEDPDGGYCYVETDAKEYCGHVRIKRALLTRDRFIMELRRKRAAHIEVMFSATQSAFDDLRRVLEIMFPDLELDLGKAG